MKLIWIPLNRQKPSRCCIEIMSERREIAERLAQHISINGLTTPYGGDVIKNGNKYTILFSKPAVLDGAINVYGDRFIQITFQTQFRDLPNRASYVYENESNALAFMLNAFVNHDFRTALAVPTKPGK